TAELRRARKLQQAKRRAGLSGAQKRWHSDSTANGNAIAKEREGNVIVKESKDTSNSNTSDQSFSSSNSLRIQALHFNEALKGIILPKSQSDRTCFRRVTNWLMEGCAAGRFNGEIFGRVLDYARQAH
ncbi:MAG: hypothetical protein ACYS80_09505, partial [Planctomycetota bacterium]